jgi:hypothetical protein
MRMKKEQIINRLSNLEVQEVSIVTNGANKKSWYVTKSDNAEVEIAEGKRLIAAKKGDVETVKAILRELLASLSDEALTELGLSRIDTTTDTTTDTTPADTAAAPADTVTAEDAESKAASDKALSQTIGTFANQLEDLKKKLEKVSSVVVPSQSAGDPAPVKKKTQSDSFITLGCKPLR